MDKNENNEDGIARFIAYQNENNACLWNEARSN